MYQQMIREDAARLGHVGANARHIEGWMRLAHSTLDGLDRRTFAREVATALDCIRLAGPEESEALAQSYGLRDEFPRDAQVQAADDRLNQVLAARTTH